VRRRRARQKVQPRCGVPCPPACASGDERVCGRASDRVQVFSSPSADHTPHPISVIAFAAFIDGLSDYIKSSPIRTLWGNVPTRGAAEPMDELMEQVVAELERLGDVEIRFAERQILLTRGGVQITP
jgi:hypothetical protein